MTVVDTYCLLTMKGRKNGAATSDVAKAIGKRPQKGIIGCLRS